MPTSPSYLSDPNNFPCAMHIVGIGGAGMAALAEILLSLDCRVSGSDLKENFRIERLRELGSDVRIGHRSENVAAADVVVHSTAIPFDNIELTAAADAGIPVWNRATLLSELSAFKEVVAVAGTHGKTTTSSMLSLILLHARRNPSFVIGGDVNEVGSGACWNSGEHLIIEADESDGSFLSLNPAHNIITSIDPDHHANYDDFQSLCRAFGEFLGQAGGVSVVHSQALEQLQATAQAAGSTNNALDRVISYGTDQHAQCQIADFTQTGTNSSFKLLRGGETWAEMTLPVPGLHNAQNATAALLMAHELGVPLDEITASLARFAGISRRFEFRGTQNNITFVDDYAHLPAEVKAAVATAASMGADRLVCVFQPHRFSRTKHLWRDFADSFAGVDSLVVADVYGSGEMPLPGVTGQLIVQAVENAEPPVSRPTEIIWAPRLDDVVQTLERQLRSGDFCLVLGAGDIHLVIDEVKDRLASQSRQPATTVHQTIDPTRAKTDWDFSAIHAQLLQLLPASLVELNWPLGRHTSYRVGGAAALAVGVNSPEELAQLASFISAEAAGLPLLVLGKGTNLLVADAGFQGLVIRLDHGFAELDFAFNQNGSAVMNLGAACSLPMAARQSGTRGLSGFEWAVGVPGSVGGAVKMNAGGHGSDMSRNLTSATCVNLSSGAMVTLGPAELNFGYRSSSIGADQVVCRASFSLEPGDPVDAKKTIADILHWRRTHQPAGQNCGSVFVNPPQQSAGGLIDQLGLKGKRVGTAQISTKHANFIIADRGGNADDIFHLMQETVSHVSAATGIQLQSETVLVGFDSSADA